MEMSEADICMEYRLSKDKRKEVSILADLNGATVTEIREILHRHGEIASDVKPMPKKPKPMPKKVPLVCSAVVSDLPEKDLTLGTIVAVEEKPVLPDEVASLIVRELEDLEALIARNQREIKEAEQRYTVLADYLKGKR